MSASLRTDSDLKADLACSGHANIIRDMESKCDVQMMYFTDDSCQIIILRFKWRMEKK